MRPTIRAAIHDPRHRLTIRAVWSVTSWSELPGSQPRSTSAEHPLRATTTTAASPAHIRAGRRVRRGVSGCTGDLSLASRQRAHLVLGAQLGTFVLDLSSLACRPPAFVP